MHTTPLISIIIPVYRVEKYIERCLRSIMQQSFCASPVECVLIDDCGGDRSIQIAKDLIREYQGPFEFRILSNQQNQGVAMTRNVGVKNANGTYLFFLDSDDSIEPDCLEILTGALKNHPNADVVMGNTYYTLGKKMWLDEKKVPAGVIHSKQLMELFFYSYIPDTVWNALFKREIIEKNDIYFISGYIHEDMLWTYRLYQRVEEFVFVPKQTLRYEDTPSSIMNSATNNYNPHLRSLLFNLNYILDHFSFSHYVDATLYVLWYLNHENDMIKKETVLPEYKSELKRIRNRILKRDLKNLRLTLVMFELLMFKPFSLLNKLKCFRHNYYSISQVTRKVAMFFSPIHLQSRNR